MLCIKIWCEDSTEHISIDSFCDETIQIRCETDELIEIWSELCEQIDIFAEDASDHIDIYSDWHPSIDIWSSFVCHLGDWRPYLNVYPKIIRFPNRGDAIRKLLVQSNLDWVIKEKIKKIN